MDDFRIHSQVDTGQERKPFTVGLSGQEFPIVAVSAGQSR
jgi:hypothetical protein